MLFITLFSLAAAQSSITLPPILQGKVDKITGIASMTCSNKYVNNTEAAFTIDDVLCDTKLVPQQFQDYIPGLQFGANTTICGGYACALRFLGCVEATYRVEAKIVTATGKAETCAERVGLDVQTCVSIGKYITATPLVAKKRAAHETVAIVPAEEQEGFTQAEFDAELAAVKAAPAVVVDDDALYLAKLMVRHHFPAEAAAANNLGLADDDTLENLHRRKRDTVSDLLKQVQLCNQLISAAIDILVAQVPALSIIKGKFGPCGDVCELAMCGLNLMCHTVARSALLSLEAQRAAAGCNKTSCSKWAPPLNVCMNAPACNNAMGQFAPGTLDLTMCPPPKTIYSAGQQDVSDCCDRCDDKCKNVACQQTTVQSCGAPQWPLCKPFVVEREDPYKCCPTCIDVCRTTSAKYAAQQPVSCKAPPATCPPGKLLGPVSPSSCCLDCVDPCSGVECPNLVTEDDCKKQGKKYLMKDRKSLTANSQCADCCPQCVSEGATGKPQVTEKPNSVAALTLSVVALIVALATAF